MLTAGLLTPISSGLGVSVAAAGSLFSAYALGLAIGGPLLTAATLRLDRRPVLVGAMAGFAIMVLAPAALPHFGWFVVTRLVAGALQGLFLAAAFTTATAVVPPERVGRALATVIAGFSLSTVLGLPLGVLVGSVLGWRGALLMVGGFALLATGLLAAVVPGVPGSRLSAASGLRPVLAPRVLAVLALSLVLFAAPGAVMGYSDAAARARDRRDRTAGERDPHRVRRGQSRRFVPGRPARRRERRAGPRPRHARSGPRRGRPLPGPGPAGGRRGRPARLGRLRLQRAGVRPVPRGQPGRTGGRPGRIPAGLGGQRGHRSGLDRQRRGLHRGRTARGGPHRPGHRARRARAGPGDPTAPAISGRRRSPTAAARTRPRGCRRGRRRGG